MNDKAFFSIKSGCVKLNKLCYSKKRRLVLAILLGVLNCLFRKAKNSSLLSVPCCDRTLEFALVSNGPDLKYSRAGAFWFFLCTTMVFAAVWTHFPRKNTHVYRIKHSNLRNSRNIESSRITSLEFAAFGNGSDIKHGRASAFRYFLSTTMVLQRTEHISLRKTNVFMSSQLRSMLVWHQHRLCSG